MNSNELFIKEIRLDRQNVIAFDEYPFNIPVIGQLTTVKFIKPITDRKSVV